MASGAGAFEDPRPRLFERGFGRGAVVAVATVKGWVAGLGDDHPQRRWFCGPCGWVLTDVVALEEPVPCRGHQKLWALPAEVETKVLAQIVALENSPRACNLGE